LGRIAQVNAHRTTLWDAYGMYYTGYHIGSDFEWAKLSLWLVKW